MGELFLGTQLVKLMKASICRYDASTGYCQNFGEKQEAYMASEEQKKILEDCFQLQHGEYPNIYMLESDILVAEISHEDAPNVWNLFGPIILAPTSEKRFTHANKKYHMLKKAGLNLQMCELDTFVTGILLCFYFLTGRELSVAEFWAHNKESMPKVVGAREEMVKNLFRYQEKEGVGLHNPYEQEIRELTSIELGDIEMLKKSIGEDYLGKTGVLSKDELRNTKNLGIVVMTLASRAAIRGGLMPEISYSMSDVFIQKIEEMTDIVAIYTAIRQFEMEYAKLVAEIRKQDEKKSKEKQSIWVEASKEYIFKHLHEKIRVQEIADYLHLNSSYLSELFKQQESMTLTDFILQEKVKLTKNLLTYSPYSYIEIATYLGFSSQSHLGKVFKKYTDMTLRQYRERYGREQIQERRKAELISNE